MNGQRLVWMQINCITVLLFGFILRKDIDERWRHDASIKQSYLEILKFLGRDCNISSLRLFSALINILNINIMDKNEFYILSKRFIENFKNYCIETDNINEKYFTGIKWLFAIQDRSMQNDKLRNKFGHYIKYGSTINLRKLLAEYCNEDDLIHFNAMCLIDDSQTKFLI